MFEDPFQPHRNGRELLLPTLLTHRPLDLVIVMLGTNDLKRHLNATAFDIAEGAGMLADVIAASGCGRDEGAPSVLLVCPPPLARLDPLDETFEGGSEKSQQLARHYAAVAEGRGCAFFDAGDGDLVERRRRDPPRRARARAARRCTGGARAAAPRLSEEAVTKA